MTKDEYKSIKIKENTIKKLQKYGLMSDSYDVVINKLMDIIEILATRYNIVEQSDIDTDKVSTRVLDYVSSIGKAYPYLYNDKPRKHERDFTSACLLNVTIEENGFRGGDSGYGGFVDIKIKNEGGAALLCDGTDTELINFGVTGDAERALLANICLFIGETLKQTAIRYVDDEENSINSVFTSKHYATMTKTNKERLQAAIEFFIDEDITDDIKNSILKKLKPFGKINLDENIEDEGEDNIFAKEYNNI